MAADYFISNKLFLWKYIPDLVVGRPIIDNWLVWYSRMTNSKIIDSTFTACLQLQFSSKGNFGKNTISLFEVFRAECVEHSTLPLHIGIRGSIPAFFDFKQTVSMEIHSRFSGRKAYYR
jgi:hypothetical protein